ncbi:MAG TPA: glycoside hydrolase family 3 C-terminal domain-containing protein [Solirubrobacteraceae bacterium]|jgi:beta-glucosidase|nr:glycoside hydrolase family 3 C-terminal domain-containing protein [Solirubrobacteraceae bacterium]
MLARLLVIVSILGGSVALPISAEAEPIYENHAYSFAERAADLVSRMTLAQKASQMDSSQAPAIPSLGVSAYGWWNEALHGVSRLQLAPFGNATVLDNTTSYPTDLALGSSWDPNLMYQEATQISDEAREVVPNNSLDLDFYSPTVNLSRDPRWGRNDETFSEDPLLTADVASQYVNGMQGQNEQGHLLPEGGGYLKTITTIKHFAANNEEDARLTGSSNMDERTLREYYTAQFRMIIAQSHPGAIMSAYNEVNGVPSAADTELIDTLARQTFGFTGYFTSDCDAIYEIVAGHHYQPPGWSRPVNNTERHALANAAGEDLDCNAGYHDNFDYGNSVPTAVGQGIQTPTDIYNVNDVDSSLERLFTARMELGEFDDVADEPWVTAARAALAPGTWTNSDANNAVTETPARLALAREAADRSLVLLKNADTPLGNGTTGKVLPLHVPTSGPFKVAVIGYFGNPSPLYLGGYASNQGVPGTDNEVTPYTGIRNAIQAIDPDAQVDFYPGFVGGNGTAASLTTIDQSAVNAAAGYNDVIVYAGTDATTGTEGVDRANLELPGAQAQLIQDVAAKNPNTVGVLTTMGDVDVSSFQDDVPAMIWSSYNGMRAGDAIADVLLGTYDPSAHLPFTWYQSDADLPPTDDYDIRPTSTEPGRTYMYYSGPVSFPFGYGLSYTTFATSNLRVDRSSLDPDDTVHVSVDVTNTGTVAGEDLVQLYVDQPDAPVASQRPIKRLEGFTQVQLGPGQTQTVTLTLKLANLAYFDQAADRMEVDDGVYGIQIGSSADDVLAQKLVTVSGRLTPEPAVLTAQPTMFGDGARGIQQRVMFPEDATVVPNLTLSMNDQSLYGFISAGHSTPLPPGTRVHFSSDHPNVVRVAPDQTIQTLRNGVATITATATANGQTASTTFIIRVLSYLDRLAVNGRALPGFHPDTLDYDVIVGQGAPTPRISAATPDHSAIVSVTQPAGVPGTGTVTVTGPDGISFTYDVNVAHRAQSDEFDQTSVGPQWSWVRQDPSTERLTRSALQITPEQGDLTGTTNTARNILLQPALGNWAMESKLTFSAPPHASTQQAGIIAYQDDEDYLRVGWEYSGGVAQLFETTQDSLSGTPVNQVLTTIPTAGVLSTDTLWLKMVKVGPRYTAYYSTDGATWVPIYNVGASLQNVKAGLFAFSGTDTINDLTVDFDYFHVQNWGEVGRVHGGSLPSPRRRTLTDSRGRLPAARRGRVPG